MKNIKITRTRASLIMAFALTVGNLFAQNSAFISLAESDKISFTEKDMPVSEQKQEKVKLISSKRNELKSLIVKEDSLKIALDLIEKDIKKNLIERDQLALAAASFNSGIKSKEWTSLNKRYKETIQAYSALDKSRQENKKILNNVNEQKELSLKEIQQEEALLAKLKIKLKTDRKRVLAQN